jgi:signal transduction histidine kinase/CheY-like chemotaxis protein
MRLLRNRHIVVSVVCAAQVFCLGLSGAWAAAPKTFSPAFDARVAEAKAAMMGEPEAAFKLSSSALEIADTLPEDRQALAEATAMWLQGEALVRLNQPKQAEPVLDAALAIIAREAPTTKLYGDVVLSRGGAMAAKGKMQAALADYQRAYEIFRRAGEARSQAKVLQNIGSIYQDAGDFERVLKYYAQSAETYAEDPALTLSAYNNRANAFFHLKRLNEAQAEYRQALALASKLKSPSLEARILTNLAAAEVVSGRLDAADRNIERGLLIATRDPSAREWIPFLWGVSAQSAQKRGDLQLAAQRFDRTFAGVNIKTTDLPFRDFHASAYQVYARLQRLELALAHLEAFKRLDDGARSLMASTNSALMAAQFDFANQDLKISKLNAIRLEQENELARNRSAVLTAGLGGVSLILVLLSVGMFSMRRSRNRVQEANTQLSTANTALAKALKARSEFLATTSHEIRTPLNGILGMTQVLMTEESLNPSVLERIKVLDNAGKNMRLLVDDLLDMAKIESGAISIERTMVDLPALLESIASLYRDRASLKGLELAVEITDVPALIVEDAARLRQILLNLLGNALKFTEAGRVTLSATVDATDSGEWLVLKVIDTGIGIPADMLDEIFESFRQVEGSTTRRFEGTGLGLTICRSLAEALGGTVLVTSAVDQGSTFTCRLPLVRGKTQVDDASTLDASPKSGLGDHSVLLVEANRLNQAMIRTVLRPQVQGLESVSSHAEALEALGKRPYSIVIADAASATPAGASVEESLAALARHSTGAMMSVILPTADPSLEVRLRQQGIELIFVKPVIPSAMVDLLVAACLHQAADLQPHSEAPLGAIALGS